MKTALTIAGSDSIGGAGIQADLKTFCANGVYGMSVITSVTSQNTLGVHDIFDIPVNHIKSQLDAVFTDIFPDAVKIGMVSSVEIINSIADSIIKYSPENIVLDTIMISTSGRKLLSDDALCALTNKLFPLVDIITPNIPEAEILSGFKISNNQDMEKAANIISNKYGTSVLLKGGHGINNSNDFLLTKRGGRWFKSEKINNPNTHGTGCTLSSAIAAGLAKGLSIENSVSEAKKYISKALEAMLDLGKGNGPGMSLILCKLQNDNII